MASDIMSSSAESNRRGFLNLPEEIQKEIISHCTQSDWICLSLVSSHFRDLAAAQLYRNFNIVFPDEDDATFDSPIDGLAGGLDTFVTSDYNYAKHLRDISLDTLSTGSKAELAYKSYLFSVSCGKFMNTLFLLTLRRAKSLDTFRWNIRVELSRPVYKALHNIKSLRHLHIRLQAGPSLYEPPPPLSDWVAMTMPIPAAPFDVAADPFVSQAGIAPPADMPPSFMPSEPLPPISTTKSTSKPSERDPERSTLGKEPTTLAGFKGLETLAILDIDNLDIVTEIKSCIRNSSSTLRKLKLSFSDDLATQARRPSQEIEPEDSDQEDDFQVVAVPPAQYNDGNGPAKIFRAQEERKAQEAVLGRIFEVEPPLTLTKENKPTPEDSSKEAEDQATKDTGQAFIDAVDKASRCMWANVKGSSEFDITSQEEAMDQIITAAKLYVESKAGQAREDTSTGANTVAPVSTGAKGLTTIGSAQQNSSGGQDESPTTGKTCSAGNGLFGSYATADNVDTKPEDIDVAAPEEQMALDGQDEPNTESPLIDPIPTKSPIDFHKAIQQSNATSDGSGGRVEEAMDRPVFTNHDIVKVKHGKNVVRAEVDDTVAQVNSPLDNKEELQRQVTDYARGTRGIALESLAIHLIPTKASVLSRAVDLRTLRKITLLNVGPQAPIWSLMIKENRLQPLPLQRIFTDNVCPYFVQLVSELQGVDEVFMLERAAKFKPESFAPKTRISIDHIRKKVLKKHMETLKVLTIKNESDSSWDLDEKTMQLVCRRGKVLEELAISAGIRAMHTFLQYLTGLKNLFALHVITFRSDDTCVSVMREMRRFIVDTLSHHPELKLEWISMGDEGRAQRVMRRSETIVKDKKDKKNKDKWKGPPVDANGHLNESGFPVFPANGWEADSESDEEDDDDSNLKLALAENIAFYDIWGVRIFKKEIVAGRL